MTPRQPPTGASTASYTTRSSTTTPHHDRDSHLGDWHGRLPHLEDAPAPARSAADPARATDRPPRRRATREGYEAIAALAAAEAVETGREHGLNYDHVEYDEEQLRWWAYYETGPRRHPVIMVLPLPHATEATQRGIASLN
jgi:hypothetical protein